MNHKSRNITLSTR